MEEDQELSFVCKLCNKKYPCGKSLGGHMRSHMFFANPAEIDENYVKKIQSLDQISVKDSNFVEFVNGQSSYGLRENPRKTWRAVDSNSNSNSISNPNPPLQFEKFCKQCGKGFQSLKALCGHMACHSNRDKGFKDDHSCTSDSHSDTEEGEDRTMRTTRSSKANRYKKIALSTNCVDNLAYNNGDSSVSEIDGDEQEELALCLMLLSRDSCNKGVVNSVVLETNKLALKEDKRFLDVKLKSSDFDVEIENSDSEYFLDECAKPESDISVGGSRKNALFVEYNKPYVSLKNKGKSYRTELNKDDDDHIISQKRSKYECFNCKKTFKSYQALGGHRPCHKRSNAYYEPRYESGDDDSNDFKLSRTKKSKKIESKKSKGHVCPFCNRVFKNGQALGGHKRSHFIGGHENRTHSPIIKPKLLDLNFPASEERLFSW